MAYNEAKILSTIFNDSKLQGTSRFFKPEKMEQTRGRLLL